MESKEKEGLREILASVDDYWFGRGSPVSLGVFRIMVGFLSLANVFLLGLHWESWFGEKGYVPDWLAQEQSYPYLALDSQGRYLIPKLNLLNGVTDSRIALAIFVMIGVFSVLTMIGLWTKVSSVALAILVISLQYRNTVILHGGDSVIRLWCIYLAVSPCGLACSVDRLIGIWKGTITREPVRVSLWSQRLITFNLAIIYFTATWLKWGGASWRNGTATYFPARLPEFFRFPYPHFVNNVPFVYLSTYGTLLIEFSMGTLVFFRPLRKWVLIAGLLMHGLIEYTMNIPLFEFLMCSAFILFYDGEEVTEWARRLGRRLRKFAGVTVSLPDGTRLRPQAAFLLEATDPLRLVTYRDSSEPNWSAERMDGVRVSAGFASWSRSIGAWFMIAVPGLWNRILRKSITPTPVEVAHSELSSVS